MDEQDASPFREIAPARRDAIHRALLSGLLASVATKTEKHEYAGPRNVKLSIHPASGLHRNQPQWLMAAELVETTRLYARTVARVHPLWVERAGEHLLKRSYADPHWNDHSFHVNAYEKVTLFGLVLVPRRLVNYGPIDPPTARQVFILQALVEGRFRTAAPFFARNRQLVNEIRRLEAKVRRRDLLVEPQQVYAFYDARLPAEVYDGPSFEAWFRHAEQHRRHQLLMARPDVTNPDAPQIDAALYPDHLFYAGAGVNTRVSPERPSGATLAHRLALSYAFDHTGDADGVTVTVPLTLLNQIDPLAFDWPVPGWIEEKVAALIRTLPKPVRTRLVPVPEVAKRVAGEIRYGEGAFLATVADRLGCIAGERIAASAFDLEALPVHLRMRVRVVDEGGRTLASSRDVRDLKERLAGVTREVFKELSDTPYHRNDLSRWDFGDLPDSVTLRRPGITVLAYPALVEDGQKVHLRLMESAESADRAMRAGVRRLFLRQLGQESRHLARNIPGWGTMALQYAPIASAEVLRDSLLQAAADEALFGRDPSVPRKQLAFAHRAADAWARLAEALDRVAAEAADALAAHHAVARLLDQPWPDRFQGAVRDVRQQVQALLPPHFALSTPPAWRAHLPRYLRAAEVRLKKLTGTTGARDAEHMGVVRPLWQRYLDAVARAPRLVGHPEAVQYRWMIEELRVSLFAQELKTALPVSPARLDKQWLLVRD